MDSAAEASRHLYFFFPIVFHPIHPSGPSVPPANESTEIRHHRRRRRAFFDSAIVVVLAIVGVGWRGRFQPIRANTNVCGSGIRRGINRERLSGGGGYGICME